MPIEYNSGDGSIGAPVIRFNDENCGIKGVIVEASERQATHWKTGQPETWDDGNPKMEYVFVVAAEAGAGYFTVYGDDGALKNADGTNQLEFRKFNEEDVAIVTTSYWMLKQAREAKLNEGHAFTWKRSSPAGVKQVEGELTITGQVDNPKRYKAAAGGGISYADGAAGAGVGGDPFASTVQTAAPEPASMPF